MPHFHSSLCMFLLNSSLSLSLSPPPIQPFEGLSPIQIGLPFSTINASISSVSLKPCSFWTRLRSQRPFHPVSQPQCQMLSDLQTSAHQNYFVDAWTTRQGGGGGSPFYFHPCFHVPVLCLLCWNPSEDLLHVLWSAAVAFLLSHPPLVSRMPNIPCYSKEEFQFSLVFHDLPN